MIRDGVVAGQRAGDIRQPRSIDGERKQLRLAGAGLEHDQLLDRLDVHQVLGERAAERLERARRATWSRRRRLIRAVRRSLQEAELLDVARERRLRDVESARRQPLAQLFLAPHRLVLHDVENG